MPAGLTSAQKLIRLWCWWDEAVAAGVSPCELISDKACAGATSGGGGAGRLISSTSSAGHSVSFEPDDQAISPNVEDQFVAMAATQCDACAGYTTKKEWAACMLAATAPVTAFRKSYYGLRTGCFGYGSAGVATATTAPATPEALDASDDLADRINLTWIASAGATTYEVWRGTEVDVASMSKIADVATADYTDTTAVLDTDYFYSVKAGNAQGTSGFSLPAKGTRRIVVSITGLVLSPTSIAFGVQQSNGTVTLSGTPGAGGAIITLSGNPPGRLTMPAQFQILGQPTGTFQMVAQSGSAPFFVDVTATYLGVSQTARLNVTP